MIRFREFPLLNTPNMVATVLGAAANAPVTLQDCVGQVQALLGRAGEETPFGPDDIAARLTTVLRNLCEARILQPERDGAFALTPRGRAVLTEHPEGFDAADMMAYPEFSRYIRGLNGTRTTLDPRSGGFDQGYAAYWSGLAVADNPFASDSADHLAWENGWSDA